MKKQYGAWLLIGFGLFMLLGFVSGGGSRGLVANIVAFLLLVMAPIAGGITLIRGQKKEKVHAAQETRKLLQSAREKEILRLAEQKKGLLTVSQIVKESSMNASEAEDALHELIVKRLVDMRTNPDGQVVYEFIEFTDAQEFEQRKLESGLIRE